MAILNSNLLCAHFCSELWDMKQVHSGIYEICLLKNFKSYLYDKSVPVLWQRGLFTMTTWTCSSGNWFPIPRLTSHLVNFSVVSYMTLYPTTDPTVLGDIKEGALCYYTVGKFMSTWRCLDMKTISVSLALCRGKSTGHQWIPLTKGQWCITLIFLWLLTWTSCGTYSWVAHDLRCHITHVMSSNWNEDKICLFGYKHDYFFNLYPNNHLWCLPEYNIISFI